MKFNLDQDTEVSKEVLQEAGGDCRKNHGASEQKLIDSCNIDRRNHQWEFP